jgi:Na+/melibiose symporter-like transporter
MLATSAAFLVFLPTGSGGALDPRFTPSSYASMGIAFGMVMIAVALVATVGTLGERWRLGGSSSSHSDGGLSIHRTISASLRDRSFRVLVLSSALSSMAITINAVLALYFLTYHVRLASSQLSTLYFVTFYVGSLIGVFVWVRVARGVEKQYVYAAATIVTGAVMSAGYWLIGQGRPFGIGATWVLFAGSGLVGLFASAVVVIAPSMMADISAREELRSGRRHHGIHFGIYSFGQQISNGLAVFFAGVLADRFARLVPGQAAQAPSTIERLVVLSNVVPAVLLVAAGLIGLRYRLTRGEVQAIQRELAIGLDREQVPELEGAQLSADGGRRPEGVVSGETAAGVSPAASI